MANQYELECGHCGFQFVIEGGGRSCSVKCAVCGGVLTVALAVPVGPETPTPAPPPPAPPPPPPPAPWAPVLPPLPRGPADFMPLEFRADRLAPPWQQVYRSLGHARIAAGLAFWVHLLNVFFVVIVIPVLSRDHNRDGFVLLSCCTVLLILPAILHAFFQLSCGSRVPREYGGWMALASPALFSAIVPAVVSLVPNYAPTAGLVGVGLFLASAALWLLFLSKMGQMLADARLPGRVGVFTLRFCAGIVLAAVFGTGAVLASQAGTHVVAWLGQLVVGVIGVLLLGEYSALLHVASETVARCAPVTSPD